MVLILIKLILMELMNNTVEEHHPYTRRNVNQKTGFIYSVPVHVTSRENEVS